MLNKKAETFHSENHYYVFVALENLGQRPKFHIVPSKVVAEYAFTSHSEWLKGKKRDGTDRRDSLLRKFI